MYFDPKLLGIHQNGRFAICWLAATNQKAYRAYFKHEDVQDTKITNLCDEILETYKSKSYSLKRNLSFQTVAQLLFGTVSIYQQQVQFLYEKTKTLFALNSSYISQETFKRPSTSDFIGTNNLKNGKKVRLNIGNKELLNETEDTNSIIISADEINENSNLVLNQTEEQNMMQITINDIDWNKNIDWNKEFENDLFDELTNEDAGYFVDVISGRKTLFDIRDEQMANKNKEKSYPLAASQITEILVTNPTSGVDTMRSAINTEENTSINIIRAGNESSITTFYQNPFNEIPYEINNTTIDLQDNMALEDIPQNETNLNNQISLDQNIPLIDTSLLSIINEIDFDAQLPPIILDDQLNNSQLTEMDKNSEIQRKKLKRNIENIPSNMQKLRKKLKIDKFTEIDSATIRSQLTKHTNLRCINPLDDAITFYEYNFKNAKNLLNRPCITFNSSELFKNFKRNIATKRTNNDRSILHEILELPFDENIQLINKNMEPVSKRKKKNHVNNCNESIIEEQTFKPCEQEFENVPVIPLIDDPPVEYQNLLLNNPNVQLVLQDINQDFFENIQNLNSSHPDDTEAGLLLKKQIYSKWNPEALIIKLLNLWKSEIYPIDMNLLAKNVKKREAALAFSSILELAAHRYIKIIKEPNTNRIEHIEIGEKVIEKINDLKNL